MATEATTRWMAARPAVAAVVVAKAIGRPSDIRKTTTAAVIQILRACDALVSSAARSPHPRRVATEAAPIAVPRATVVADEWGNRTPRCTPASWVTTAQDAAAETPAAATVA
jgi:hypothetical protein